MYTMSANETRTTVRGIVRISGDPVAGYVVGARAPGSPAVRFGIGIASGLAYICHVGQRPVSDVGGHVAVGSSGRQTCTGRDSATVLQEESARAQDQFQVPGHRGQDQDGLV